MNSETPDLQFQPLTPDRWRDFETLFGPSGAFSGCWCMWWRLTRTEFNRRSADERKSGMKSLVDSGEVPGIVAYVDGQPAGWCSVAPRERFGSLERSRILKRLDERPVWSVVCFFVGRRFRGRGVMGGLLQAAVDHARQQGADVVEGYPVEGKDKLPGGTKAYVGIASAFRQAGFVEVGHPAPDRRVMRYYIGGTPKE